MTINELYQNGWTVRAAARAIGVSANHLSLILIGKRHSRKLEVQLQALPVRPPLRRSLPEKNNTPTENEEQATPPMTKWYLRDKGWSNRAAARALGISESHLSLILQGKRRSKTVEAQLQALPDRMLELQELDLQMLLLATRA